MDKMITLLGSTGSIGTQTLDVVRMHHLQIYALAANRNIRLLEQQVREFDPKKVLFGFMRCIGRLAGADIDRYGGTL